MNEELESPEDDDVVISHIKQFLSILLKGTPLLEEFEHEEIDQEEEDPSITQQARWLEKLSAELCKDSNLFCGSSTRGVPQKLLFVLRECALMHRWCEASRVLSICHRETTCDLQFAMWKVGMEILYAEFQRDASSLVERLIKLQNLLVHPPLSHDYMQIEYLMYYSTIDDLEKTQRVILSDQGLVKRYQLAENIKKSKYYKGVLSAYQGLLLYKLWVKGTFQGQVANRDLDTEHVLSSYLDKMTECFSTFYQEADPSDVHDIVIVPHIRTLEHVGKFQEAMELLRKYRSLNPQNPNAHRYYYYFLCRRNYTLEERLEVLKTLATYVPSDPLVLTLCEYLEDDLPSCLGYLFDLLDYDCWKNNQIPWKQLVATIEKYPSVDRLSETLHPLWSQRKSWWPHYHFRPLRPSYKFRDSDEEHLYAMKVKVASFLKDPQLNFFIKTIEKRICN